MTVPNTGKPGVMFSGKLRFLSNFYPASVFLDRQEYPSVEHAYQAAKTLSPIERREIRFAPNPAIAKRLGKLVTKRPDWEEVKLAIMEDLVRQKFNSDPELAVLLISTDDLELIETNTWGDTFWGVCGGEGRNELGKVLMKVREELRLGDVKEGNG